MNDRPAAQLAPGRRRRLVAGAALFTLLAVLAVLAGVALGEWAGWPWLAAPLQRQWSEALDRRVRFSTGAEPADAMPPTFRVRFVGGLRLHTSVLEIGAPGWSAAPHLLLARDVALELRYVDLWRAYRGQPLRIHRLRAGTLDAYLERSADGRASWWFGPRPLPGAAVRPLEIPSFGRLQVEAGRLHVRDAPWAIDVEARLSLADALQASASGQYRGKPLQIELLASGVLPSAADEAQATPAALSLEASVGRAHLVFKGSARDVLHLSGLDGRFWLKGPSLAAVGDPLGVSLPTTAAFQATGGIAKQGDTWRVLIDDATVGASRLNGAFSYEAGTRVPLLSGRLGGRRLWLADLGPVVGTTPAVAAATVASTAASGPAPAPLAASTRGPGRVLPDRPFDLPAMRTMDANVLIDIDEVDLNSSFLQPLQPLRAHLRLSSGVLTLSDIDARTADGKLMGDLRLDGRASTALWDTRLRWSGVRVDRWVRQERADGAPPFVSGQLHGSATLSGQGRSTAQILASLKGRARIELRDGAVSHLAIEAAGLDLAQTLGVLLKGDDALPVQCAVADLVAEGGVFRPRVMVLDTSDSTVWVEGSLSLAAEALDLRTVVVPKDFSPLTLRTPLRVRGSFVSPKVSVEKGPMGRKLGLSFLLTLVNPLAALIPLIDPGDADAAERAAAGCQRLTQRNAARTAATGSKAR